MRAVTRSLLLVATLAWAVAGVGAATFIWQNAANRAPRAHAQVSVPTAPAPEPAPATPPPTVKDVAPPVVAPAAPVPLGGARALSTAFTQVAAALRPAVVRITIEKGSGMRGPQPGRRYQFRGPFGGGDPFGGGSPFGGHPFGGPGNPFDFHFGDPDDDAPAPRQVPRQSGLGSGVIIDPQGYVLTNNHVVANADRIKAQLSDGRSFTAKLVGADPKTDIALIKIEGAGGLPAARLGNSDQLQVGELVVAIGNPYGLNETVTVGVVSAKGRDHLQGGPVYEDFIQTDATINPGNSGGPLVNLNGEVIGINTAIKLAQFGYTGIGFAIPSNMARHVADQLRSGGRVRRAWLGVNIQDLTPDLAKGLGADAPPAGALIAPVAPDSPAEKGGLQAGDVVAAVGSTAVKTSKDLQRSVLETPIGKPLHLLVWRKGQQRTLAVTTGEMPDDAVAARRGAPGGDAGAPSYGLELRNLTPDLAQRYGLRARSGAIVAQVTPGSPAEEAGLAAGDVIIEVNRRPVRSAAEVGQALRAPCAAAHLLRVQRGDAAIYVMLKR
ncbi:MAG: Do family serine endopeptidase [Deltaproteobacteria bacterium]|nr:Do family serine endopeptidase [Deltaproteobacteria bacterium]